MKTALRIVGSVLAIVTLGILATVLVVWVYSTFLAPGKTVEHYQAFAKEAGPWVSVIAGPLITYCVVRLTTKRMEPRHASQTTLWIIGAYLCIDIGVLALTDPQTQVWAFAVVSATARCLAAWLAVRQPLRATGTPI